MGNQGVGGVMAFKYLVSFQTIDKARFQWHTLERPGKPYIEQEFMRAMGVTDQQYHSYKECWALVVTRETYKKFEIMASGTPHYKALFKVVDIKK
jgi:hypothetical protein